MEHPKIKKLSSAQFFATIVFTMIVSALAGFGGGISGLVAVNNENFYDDIPVLRQLQVREKVEDTIRELTIEQRRVEESSSIIDAIEKVKPSVVSLIVEDTKYDYFLGENSEQRSGTGFFVTRDGLIATNKHNVCKDALCSDQEIEQKIYVITDSGNLMEGKLLDFDPINDLAFVKVTDQKGNKMPPPVSLGKSEELVVGQKIIAIGNALGENDNTVTEGIVSVLGKTIVAGDGSGFTENLEGVIQISAAINPGNSGGPLINLDGQVVGMNTAGSQSAQNINYAIPSNSIKPVFEKLADPEIGEIDRSFLGVYAKSLNKSMKALLQIENPDVIKHIDGIKGALVYSVDGKSVAENSPADKIGLRDRDIILSIDGIEILPDRPLGTVLSMVEPNKTIEINYARGDRMISKAVQLESAKENLKNS